MKLIGLTGGIGTGKSAVADLLRKRGWVVYSSDATAKELMGTNPELRAELAQAFGPQVLTPNGVDAPALSALVFGDSPEHQQRLALLNRLVHPQVLQAHMEAIEEEVSRGTPIVAVESALLFEVDLEEGFDWVVVVDAPPDVCLRRVMERSKLTEAQVHQRMSEQMPMEEKRGLADFVVENAGSIADLERSVELVATLIEAFPDTTQ